jgi:Nif-specific regulatory protein
MTDTNKKNSSLGQFHAQQLAIEDYEKLFHILQTICSTMDVDEILAHIIEQAITLCNAHEGSILLFDPESKELAKTLVRKQESGKKILDHYLNTLLTGWIFHNRSSLITDNIIDTFGEKRIRSKYQKVTSALSMPLALQGEILGVINLITLDQQNKFGEREKQLMEVFSSLCAQFIVNAHLHESLFAETQRLQKEVQDKYAPHGIIGNSPKMREVFSLLERISCTEGRVLLEGESGTGKELIAKAIHYNGPRKDNQFVAVDCGALPANLLESELFGYVKGAFTGANQDKKGLFEEAHKGTLFLDEIANVQSEVQAKFLRAIQEGEIRPLGTTQVRKVDVRIIAAASNNLRIQVDAGNFRQDLFYRLNVVNIALPPLRERKEDISILANHFLKKLAQKYDKRIKGYQAETMVFLETYSWPGNVRELENVVERIVILADQKLEYIDSKLLPAEILSQNFKAAVSQPRSKLSHSIKTKKELYEREMLLEALSKNDWNQSAAARALGIHEKTVRYKMQKFGIKKQ